MTVDLPAAWTGLAHSPLLGITLTLIGYQAARMIGRVTRGHPAANPVLISLVIVAGILLLTRLSYRDYLLGAGYIGFLLGPATVALALPLHRQARRMRQSALAILSALVVGSAASIATALLVTRAAGGNTVLALTMAPKSATTPVAIAVSQGIGGTASLTAVFTIVSGVLGAVAGPTVLSLIRIRDERVRGLAIGVSSHGIGTSRLLADEPSAAGFSALGMALNALATAILVPVVVPLLHF